MADETPQKRTLPPRERRESAAKRRALSPAQSPTTTSTPATHNLSTTTTSTVTSTPVPARKTGYVRGPYKKRVPGAQAGTPISASRSSPSISTSGDVLLSRFTAHKSLPTTKQKQPAKVSLSEYQSVAESAVLATSLFQSRMQWLYNGVFQKYYVKKRKGVEVPANNPDVKSMQRLGSATMTIEPHTFDVMFYVVRESVMPQSYHPDQHITKPMAPPSHPVAYPPIPPRPGYQRPTPPLGQPPAMPQTRPATPVPVTSQPAPVADSTMLNPATPAPQKKEEVKQPVARAPRPSQISSPTPPPPEPSKQTPTPQPAAKAAPAPPAKGSTQDPVIQMLAARAATDPKLKELMKIVATSRASAEQLKEFQSHIDEFNEVIRRQDAARAAKSEETPAKQPSLTPLPENSQSAASTQAKSATPAASQTPKPALPPALPPSPAPSTQATPQPPPRQPPMSSVNPAGSATKTLPTVPHPVIQAGRGGPMGSYIGYPPAPVPRPEPFIKHIVMELTSVPSGNYAACPDRWLFPEHAVLEMKPNGLDMICSFLVARKGSQIMSVASTTASASEAGETKSEWKSDQEYYEPVTMTLKARDHKIIQTIAKAAKTLPVVQEYMQNVMSTKTRAPREFLIYQLPREKSLAKVGVEGGENGFVDSGVEMNGDDGDEDDEVKDFYGF